MRNLRDKLLNGLTVALHPLTAVPNLYDKLPNGLDVPADTFTLAFQRLLDTHNAFGQLQLLLARKCPGLLQPFRQVILYIRTDGFELLIVHKHTSALLIVNDKVEIIQMPNRHLSHLITAQPAFPLEPADNFRGFFV